MSTDFFLNLTFNFYSITSFPEPSPFLLYLSHYKFSYGYLVGAKKKSGLGFVKNVFLFSGNHYKRGY